MLDLGGGEGLSLLWQRVTSEAVQERTGVGIQLLAFIEDQEHFGGRELTTLSSKPGA